MVSEVSAAVLAILVKSLVETDLESAMLRKEYNMAGAEVFTRAVDLMQTRVLI